MDFIQRLQSTPVLFIVAFILVGESCVVFLTGFAGNDWFTIRSNTYGLWKVCLANDYGYGNRSYVCESLSNLYEYDLYKQSILAARLMCFVSLGCQVGAAALLLTLVFRSRKTWATSACVCCAGASGAGIIGAVVFFANELHEDAMRSWGGVLVIMAAVMQAHAAVCIVLPVVRGQAVFEDSQPRVAPIGGSQGQILGYPNQQYGTVQVPPQYQATPQGVPGGYLGAPHQCVPAPYQGPPSQGVPAGYQGAQARGEPNKTRDGPVPAST
ncbi:hypothetical protein BaRGS_00023745 [Batillaria attramentaria]|uniref:Claudin n=1 Tax=Batillaria attramentaria TaxID=370345 RepID=A0ABD0KD75_9CAEN